MQTVNDFIFENLNTHGWHLAFIGYDFEMPGDTLMWYHTPVVASELPANVFFPHKGVYQVMIAVTPLDLFNVTGGYVERESVLRLAATMRPKDIKAVAVGERYSEYDIIHVDPSFKEKVYGDS